MPASRVARAACLRALARLSRLVPSSLDLGVIMAGIARAAAEFMQAPVVSFWMVDEATRTLTVKAFSNEAHARDFPVTTLDFGQGGVGWVAQHQRPLNVPDVFSDGRFHALDWWKRRRLSSFYAVPVIVDGAPLAVLALHGRRPFRFSADDRDLLESFVARASGALANARLLESAERRCRQAEALAEAERRYRLLFERNVAGVFRWTRDGRVLECNESVARILGYASREEVLAERTEIFWVDLADRDRLLARIDQDHPFSNEVRLRRKDGTEIWALVSITPVRECGTRWLDGVLLDITDRKRMEAAERALESLHSVSSLASAAAHEIYNPLTVVMGSLDLVARRVDDATVREWVDRGREAVRRIRDVVDRMSRISQLQLAQDAPGLPPMLDIRRSSAEPPASDVDRVKGAC